MFALIYKNWYRSQFEVVEKSSILA